MALPRVPWVKIKMKKGEGVGRKQEREGGGEGEIGNERKREKTEVRLLLCTQLAQVQSPAPHTAPKLCQE